MDDEASNKVSLAAADMESAQYELDHARYDLRDQLLAGLGRGVPLTDLARDTGMSAHQVEAIIRLPD